MDLGLKLVEAKTFEGAIYGLGFAQAKDRLWQMHFLRRLAFGRVSEVRHNTLSILYIVWRTGINYC